jgi:hypothetical protein
MLSFFFSVRLQKWEVALLNNAQYVHLESYLLENASPFERYVLNYSLVQ